MRRIPLFALSVGLLVSCLGAAPASAQATRTWVSGVGDDLNPCSRTAPCKTFAGAISKTIGGGEINCLDPGGFGAVTITKSMTISCEGVTAGIASSSTTGIIVNALSTDFVFLKGLDIDGGPPGTPGVNGIRMLSAAYVHVEDCVIRNFKAVAPNGFGIKVDTAGALKFLVTRTTLFNNGTAASGGAILVKPTGNATQGLIDKTIVDRNVFGITVDGTAGTTGLNISVRDSAVSGNSQTGILAATGAVGTGVMITRTAVSNNITGVSASGAGAVVRVGNSEITGNATGVSGTVNSYGTNQLDGNGVNGTLTLLPAPALK
jgi:hypothetical protein